MMVETYVAAKRRVPTQQNLKTKIEVKALLKMEVEVRQYHFKNNDSELYDYALFFNFAIE